MILIRGARMKVQAKRTTAFSSNRRFFLAAFLLVPLSAQAQTESFSISDRGGLSVSSQGTFDNTTVGYAGIRPDEGMTTPSGVAIFGLTQNGVLITEAGVPAVTLVQEGRMFAEVGGPVNTGVAFANPNDVDATINFLFTDTSGVNFGSGNFQLAANQQTAKFLNEEPFNGGSSVLGTFTFTSSVPISVVALRGFTNEQSDFLMTTLPVAPLSSTSSETVYFPHFADGSGWTTQVVLVNPTDSTMTGIVQFLGQGSGPTAATPVSLMLNDGSSGSSFPYSIPERSSQRFTTSNPAGTVSVGSVRATPNGGSTTPSGLVIFSFVSGGVTVSEAGVPALPEGAAFRVYVEASGTPTQIGSVRSGVAITDTSGSSNAVTLEVTDLAGVLAAAPETISIPPSGHVARFLDELFSLSSDFSGVLRVASTSNVAIAGLRLRINERGETKMTTVPPSDEVSATTSAARYFSHIVDSEGWSTQFVVFSGAAGQTSSGMLQFFDQTGDALNLSVVSSAGSVSGDVSPYAGSYAIMNETTGTEVTVTVGNGFRTIVANGLPAHDTGQFPNAENPNAISAQDYAYTFSAEPQVAAEPTSYNVPQPFGIAVNGVVIDPFAAEWYNDDRNSGWQLAALANPLGFDEDNAHVQPNGAYHYHGAPLALLTRTDQPELIGFAGDGFPIYGPYGYQDAQDGSSVVVQLRSSYQLKAGTRPSGPGGSYDGTYVEDYEYVDGAGGLDECNGRTGVTPEYPDGTYYYVVSFDWPSWGRCFTGAIADSFIEEAGGLPPRPSSPPE